MTALRRTFCGILVAIAAPAGMAWAVPAADKPQLAPHRAIYDLKLLRTRGSRGIEAVRGRILYDFTGSACAGYELQFRQVSELDSGEGKPALSDLRATTWEDIKAGTFRFSSENRVNDRPVDIVDGNAMRRNDNIAVALQQPSAKSLKMPVEAVFPTEHMQRIIAAALAGKSVLELKVYDGSETGEKLYDTLTVIGHAIGAGDKPPQDAAAKAPQLAKLPRWPVTISYFEHRQDQAHGGEQTPIYAISFELYENGISRALILDYTDFVISGEMTSLDMKSEQPCK